MEFNKEDYVSNLYDVSKSSVDGTGVFENAYKTIEVYNFDKIKEWFCETYRNKTGNLKSCDAYYQYPQQKDYLVMEFKNTHHFKIKSFMGELGQKCADTHMLLAETFWKNRKTADIAKTVNVCIVYNDSLNYGNGITNLCHNLNKITPIQGNAKRNTKEPIMYQNENEYEEAVRQMKCTYQGTFYEEIRFVDKEEFVQNYVEGGYFRKER